MHRAHYLLGPYCGQSNVSNNFHVELSIQTFSTQFMVVIYNHPAQIAGNIDIETTLNVVEMTKGFINPCSSLLQLCQPEPFMCGGFQHQ